MRTQAMSRAELKAKLDGKERFHLWNVLSAESYRPEANIPGSAWVPLAALTERFLAHLVPGKGETIVVYCGGPACPSSKQAAAKLQSLGYTDVFAYEGGLSDWSENGLPLVKAAG
ncbi:rhodanese-like domain-containing protein [bacterium]|nr:MAG: rhodanese-like domain-containing protein [bacterium]